MEFLVAVKSSRMLVSMLAAIACRQLMVSLRISQGFGKGVGEVLWVGGKRAFYLCPIGTSLLMLQLT